jgi:NAD(P)-dependent dehydrogenase (short-subunit alcohol dehydrogenase family)
VSDVGAGGPRAALPGALVGAAYAVAASAGTALLLYTGQGFLRAAGLLLAISLGTLAAGLWAGAEPTSRPRRRWGWALLGYLIAAAAAAGWERAPALHAQPLGGALGMLLLLAAPAYGTGLLLATRTRARAPVPALAGAALGVLLAAGTLIPRLDPAVVFALAAGALLVGMLYERSDSGGAMTADVVIISGVGARGQLGYALAERFVRAGWRVVITGRDEAVHALAASLGTGSVVGVTADLTHDEDAERVVAAALERWGRVDALLNAAGGLGLVRAASETTLAELEREVQRNAGTLLVLTRAALPALRRSQGAVVNFASPAVERVPATLGAYAAAKAGVVALTRALAAEEKGHGVRVNAIAPGTMDTAQNRESMPAARYVKRADVAEAAFFLASRAAAGVSGEVLTVRVETTG